MVRLADSERRLWELSDALRRERLAVDRLADALVQAGRWADRLKDEAAVGITNYEAALAREREAKDEALDALADAVEALRIVAGAYHAAHAAHSGRFVECERDCCAKARALLDRFDRG